jgi:Niemann-Pick C1 protein
VYPYSIFHIFFEQYLNTHRDVAILVGLPLLAVFVTAWIFTGGVYANAVCLSLLMCVTVDMGGGGERCP